MRNELNESKLKRHREQTSYILKNKLNQMARIFIDTDFNKTGRIDYKNFHYQLRQMGFTEKLVPDTDIDYIFDKFKTKDNYFNYPSFLRELKNFDYKSTDLRVKRTFYLTKILHFFIFLV